MPGQAATRHSHGQRPRELRRRVMLRARMRASSGWSDACILNVSSRGLMINASTVAAVQGNTIEVWHGDHVIVGTVMWRKGTRAGLQAEERVPVDDILALSQSPSLQLTAEDWPKVDRRKKTRNESDSRLRGRLFEFAGVSVMAAALAIGAFTIMQEAFARPLKYVEAALGG